MCIAGGRLPSNLEQLTWGVEGHLQITMSAQQVAIGKMGHACTVLIIHAISTQSAYLHQVFDVHGGKWRGT